MSDLPKFQYHPYEQTPFDKIPVLEGVIDGLVYFGVVSLKRADGNVDDDPEFAYGSQGKMWSIAVGKVQAKTYIIKFSDAFQRVNDDQLANYLEQRRRALLGSPVTVGKEISIQKAKTTEPPVKVEVIKKDPEKIVQNPPVTTAELVLQMATMQADFDLRLRVMAQRLAALEAKQ